MTLQLDGNKFEGCIPDGVASWRVSREVFISENMLSGAIPGFMSMDVSYKQTGDNPYPLIKGVAFHPVGVKKQIKARALDIRPP